MVGRINFDVRKVTTPSTKHVYLTSGKKKALQPTPPNQRHLQPSDSEKSIIPRILDIDLAQNQILAAVMESWLTMGIAPGGFVLLTGHPTAPSLPTPGCSLASSIRSVASRRPSCTRSSPIAGMEAKRKRILLGHILDKCIALECRCELLIS
jgi:hypothetical protein